MRRATDARQEFVDRIVIAAVMYADEHGIHDADLRQQFADDILEQLSDWLKLPEAPS